MSNYVETTISDENRDGVYDNYVNRFVIESFWGGVDWEYTERDNGIDGVDSTTFIDIVHDDYGKVQYTYTGIDQDGNGTTDVDSWHALTYNSDGKLYTESVYSSDWNVNGLPDYSQTTTTLYNAAGQVTSNETFYYFDNQWQEQDYRLETFTYNAKGLLSELTIDDWSLFDFEVGQRFSYNTPGLLVKVEERDEFVYGDNNWHTAQKNYYTKGVLTEHNDYAEFYTHFDNEVPGQNVLEIKTKLSYDSAGRISSELKTGQDWGWHTVEKELVENTYDASGHLVSKLYSVDEDLNGVWDTTNKTLEQFAYDADGNVNMHSIDYGANGSLEFLFQVSDWNGELLA